MKNDAHRFPHEQTFKSSEIYILLSPFFTYLLLLLSTSIAVAITVLRIGVKEDTQSKFYMHMQILDLCNWF